MTTIEESKDPNTLGLDELIGPLITYEMKLKHKEKKEYPALSTKNIGITFKFTIQKEIIEGDVEDEQMTMFAKRFNKLMKMNKNEYRRFQRRDMDKRKEKDQIVCYDCKKFGPCQIQLCFMKEKQC